ncbi:hypothetical protein ACP70R_007717 [Stipagrostis hirtigluma subsp. patula]
MVGAISDRGWSLLGHGGMTTVVLGGAATMISCEPPTPPEQLPAAEAEAPLTSTLSHDAQI